VFMPLSSKAQKLILLLMDGAALPNEQDIAVRKLTECLRHDYPDGYALLADWNKNQTSAPPPSSPGPPGESPYGRFVLRFGMHKGEMLKDVPVDYLLHILDWPDIWPQTRTAIQKYLEQAA
jgi:hypothetical protein